MKKVFLHLFILVVWSVGGAYASSENDAPVALEKPGEMSCMVWLGDLEGRRDAIVNQLANIRDWSDEGREELQDELNNISYEISRTIGGRYGISDTPATTEEREKILSSIHRTRQFDIAVPNAMYTYLSYKEVEKQDPLYLSKASLEKIAKKISANVNVLESHLAAIAVADGASFSLKVPHANMDMNTVVENILFTHDEEDAEDLNRLLDTLPASEKHTLIQTLMKVTQDSKTYPFVVKDLPVQQKVRDQLVENNKETFLKFLHPETGDDGNTIDPDIFPLKICARLKVGIAELYWDVCSLYNESDDILEGAWRNLASSTEATLADLLDAADGLKELGKSDLALDAWQKVIEHRDVSAESLRDAIRQVRELAGTDKSKKAQDLSIKVLETQINHPDATVEDLKEIVTAFENLKRPDMVLQARAKIIEHPDANPTDLTEHVKYFQKIGEVNLEIRALEKIRDYKNRDISDLKKVAKELERLKNTDSAAKAWEMIINHKHAPQTQDLKEAAQALERLKKPDLAIQALKKIINKPYIMMLDYYQDELNELKRLGGSAALIEVLQGIINNPNTSIDNLKTAAEELEKLNESGLAILAWKKFKGDPAVDTDEKQEAEEAIKRLTEGLEHKSAASSSSPK
ncbi:hypothetical protein [Candidatus Finniella inopinata]|uniref:Tetratricopeptide repeat protein n=1 Tax=Candidatus Finniella inopinata TaxID=1696036 RepID=A0A4Q7DHN8_9PROT|nr:hypothetical protein [Candidatus Finniella inopinata]RZI45860.1 hypothetical protein EQU50_05360 [Candidatus Finniella inopinata]